MKVSVRRTVTVAAVLAVVLLTIWVYSYHTFEFKGGLSIQDSGFFSYPRYQVRVGEVPLWKNGEYHFAVRGLPPVPLDLRLEVRNATAADSVQLMSLPTFITVSIADRSAKAVCRASGRLSDRRNQDGFIWVLTADNSGAWLWQTHCQNVAVSRFKSYVVNVTVGDVDPQSHHWTIIPILEGGGSELP
ncbi:MAG TPA: hypothetical protein VJW20_00360 [Candidatus Angelobacter sp.]|nr:hypothetical protein [Candidatus Angelobacter sp.]